MRRLFPEPTDPITVAEAYAAPRHVTGRPWVGLCMVASIDGTTVVEDNSRALGSPADTQVLVGLRRLADTLLVGASTVRIEGYGPPSKPGQRVGVVSRTGRGLDLDAPLFTSGAGFLVLPDDAPAAPVDTVRAGRGDVDLAAALVGIAELTGATYVQCEGGAALNAAMAAADLFDEIDLTLSPHLAGGDGPRVTVGAPAVLQRFDLAHVLDDDGFLFTRYVRRR